MTLREIWEFIGPLLDDPLMSHQSAQLTVHCMDANIEVRLNKTRGELVPSMHCTKRAFEQAIEKGGQS